MHCSLCPRHERVVAAGFTLGFVQIGDQSNIESLWKLILSRHCDRIKAIARNFEDFLQKDLDRQNEPRPGKKNRCELGACSAAFLQGGAIGS
jgi:hypothetical protein